MALFGDADVILVPLTKPPSAVSVQRYAEGRKLYKLSKKQTKNPQHSGKKKAASVALPPDRDGGSDEVASVASPPDRDGGSEEVASVASPLDRDGSRPKELEIAETTEDTSNCDASTGVQLASPSFIASTPAAPRRPRRSSLRATNRPGHKTPARRVSFEADVLPVTPIPRRLSQLRPGLSPSLRPGSPPTGTPQATDVLATPPATDVLATPPATDVLATPPATDVPSTTQPTDVPSTTHSTDVSSIPQAIDVSCTHHRESDLLGIHIPDVSKSSSHCSTPHLPAAHSQLKVLAVHKQSPAFFRLQI